MCKKKEIYTIIKCFIMNQFNFGDQKLLINIVTNLDTNLQNKKLLVTKIITIMNKKNYN